jgi:hypothetical protein
LTSPSLRKLQFWRSTIECTLARVFAVKQIKFDWNKEAVESAKPSTVWQPLSSKPCLPIVGADADDATDPGLPKCGAANERSRPVGLNRPPQSEGRTRTSGVERSGTELVTPPSPLQSLRGPNREEGRVQLHGRRTSWRRTGSHVLTVRWRSTSGAIDLRIDRVAVRGSGLAC